MIITNKLFHLDFILLVIPLVSIWLYNYWVSLVIVTVQIIFVSVLWLILQTSTFIYSKYKCFGSGSFSHRNNIYCMAMFRQPELLFNLIYFLVLERQSISILITSIGVHWYMCTFYLHGILGWNGIQDMLIQGKSSEM